MISEVLYSSNTDEWETPQHVFDQLDHEFGFTLDACANEHNHKCKRYYDMNQDGLKQSWNGEVVWCNPPYSEVAKWIEKAFYETKSEKTVVVLLVFSRTDTRWFQDYVYNRAEVRFIKGRLRFGTAKHNAPAPSMVVIFRGAKV